MADNDCANCPTCVAQRKKAERIERRFCDVELKKDKLISAYESNMRHIQAQMSKIKVAERIKQKFELNLKANKEDMVALKAMAQQIYDDMDADGNLHYNPEKKVSALASLTLPPPAQPSAPHPNHSQNSSSDAHTPQDEEPSTSS